LILPRREVVRWNTHLPGKFRHVLFGATLHRDQPVRASGVLRPPHVLTRPA
jgi:hypothetical protein